MSAHPFTCKACSWSGFPSFELVGTKMLARCMNDVCGQIDASVTPADMNTAIARKDGKDVVVSRGAAVQAAPLAKVTPAIAASEVAQPAAKLIATPLNAIKAIKARRRWLKTEIKRLEALKAEDAQLAAAEHAVRAFKRADNVRPIRKGAS